MTRLAARAGRRAAQEKHVRGHLRGVRIDGAHLGRGQGAGVQADLVHGTLVQPIGRCS